jgi:hypothetical protein
MTAPRHCPRCGARLAPAGVALQARRLEAGLSLRELARLGAYSDHRYLQRVETGTCPASARLISVYDAHCPKRRPGP